MVYQKTHALRGRVNLALKQVKMEASVGRRVVRNANDEAGAVGGCGGCDEQRRYEAARALYSQPSQAIDALPRSPESVPELDDEDESERGGIQGVGAAE